MTDPPSCERDRNRYETILESLEDGVYAVDPDGILVYVNDRYAEMKGVSRETLLGTHVHEWATDAAVTKATSAREAIATGDEDRGVIEYEFETASGETFPVEMRFDVVPEHDDLDRVGVVRDITERKRREEALRERNERLDEFASIVSHDLRNPLNVASGRLELFRASGEESHLEHVERAHDRMEALVDDLLMLARAGDELDETTAVHLADVAESAWQNVVTPGATLEVDGDYAFLADETRLEGLFENLIRNAVEHGTDASDPVNADRDGAATTDAPSDAARLTVRVGALADRAGFFFADDGDGIPPDERDSVFESGYTTADDGTGFGLSIVEAIAAAHGWSVDVTPSRDGGARFAFTGVDPA
ncbi:two-component system sensor histidine kinase NtrB [Halorubrum sp. SY-15]|uniref:two-component system sensor histidine kinase NtrB n=1 Tax=Halorubrum sp. SY-15 TaxID=3402277 RepID=UPI003EBC9DC6